MFNQETVNAQFLNHRFLEAIDGGPQMVKEAGDAMSAFVRQKLREEGFTRKILPPQMVSAADLDPDVDSDEPRIICEKEPDSVAARIALTGKAEMRYYKGPRYEVVFEKITSDEFKKSKFELATYKTDIRGVLQENSVKDIQEQEDKGFYDACVAIATAQSNVYSIAGGVTIPNVMEAVKKLTAKKLPVGALLMTHQMYLDILKQPSTQVGSPLASSLLSGQAGLDNFYGYKIITTIKNDIIPDNRIMVFTQPNFLGQFYALQDAVVYLKTEADMLSFTTYEAVGVGIGNVNGVMVCDF